jgi:hypothetical protein
MSDKRLVYRIYKEVSAGHTPVILATWEAEIRRITIQDQPGQTVPRLHLNG